MLCQPFDRIKVERCFSLLWLFAPGFIFSRQTPQMPAKAELSALLTICKEVHSEPELSRVEERTSAMVAKELNAAGCEVTDHVGKYEKPFASQSHCDSVRKLCPDAATEPAYPCVRFADLSVINLA
jgi:hypothetical protein